VYKSSYLLTYLLYCDSEVQLAKKQREEVFASEVWTGTKKKQWII